MKKERLQTTAFYKNKAERLQQELKECRTGDANNIMAKLYDYFLKELQINVKLRSNGSKLVLLRDMYSYILFNHYGKGLTEIGRFLNRTHGAILRGLERCDENKKIEANKIFGNFKKTIK